MGQEKILHWVNPISKILPLDLLVNISGEKFFLPFWHAVNDNPPPHYNLLFPVPTKKEFIKSLDRLLRKFNPVTLDEFLKMNQEGKTPVHPVMHLSFDDGLRECYEIIAPILKDKGVPATFFINPSFIGNGSMFYRFRESLLANKLHEKNLPECMLAGITHLLMKNEIPFSSLAQGILSVGYEKQELLEKASWILEIDFGQYIQNQQPYMTQEEVRGLISKGFTIGAHSLDHPHFSVLTMEEQVEQTVVSSERISMEYSLGYMAFAFPFTDSMLPQSFWRELSSRIGYELPTFGTSGLKRDTAPSSYQRIPMEIKGLNVLEITKSEYLYHLLKRPFGKNKLQRK